MQDLPRHQHSDPRLSVSFQSQTRWMAGEWKSWLKPNLIPLLPSTVRAPLHSVCNHPYAERATSPALFHTSFSYHPPARLTLPEIQIYIWKIYLLYIYNNQQFVITHANLCVSIRVIVDIHIYSVL